MPHLAIEQLNVKVDELYTTMQYMNDVRTGMLPLTVLLDKFQHCKAAMAELESACAARAYHIVQSNLYMPTQLQSKMSKDEADTKMYWQWINGEDRATVTAPQKASTASSAGGMKFEEMRRILNEVYE